MNKKIIKCALVGLIGINLFLILSGIIVPWLISTNQLPLAAIFFLTSAILVAIVTILCYLVYKASKSWM